VLDVRLLRFALLLFAVVLASAACSRAHPRARVVAGPFAVYDLVRRVAGPDADVVFVGPDAAPEALAEVAMVVLVGLGHDAALEARARAASPKARVLKAADRVPTLEDKAAPPYVWLDPNRARILTKAIAEELARSDASHANAYRKRADDLDATLEVLDRELAAKLGEWKQAKADAAVPRAFAYMADRYGLAVAEAPTPAVAPDPFGAESYEVTLRKSVSRLAAHRP